MENDIGGFAFFGNDGVAINKAGGVRRNHFAGIDIFGNDGADDGSGDRGFDHNECRGLLADHA